MIDRTGRHIQRRRRPLRRRAVLARDPLGARGRASRDALRFLLPAASLSARAGDTASECAAAAAGSARDGADCFHGLNQRLPRVRRGRAVATFHDLFVMTASTRLPSFARASRRRRARRRRAPMRSSRSRRSPSGRWSSCCGVDPARVHVVHHGLRPLPYRAAGAGEGGSERRARSRRGRTSRGWWRHSRRCDCVVAAGAGGLVRLRVGGDSGRASREARRASASRSSATCRRRELASWYARAAIFAFPSLDEGFGMPVLEAMAARRPGGHFEPLGAARKWRAMRRCWWIPRDTEA